MIDLNVKFWRAIGTMIGGIVGVGVFGLPYAFAQGGLLPGLILMFVLGAFLVALQLMFAEIIVQTGGQFRLVGYVRKYLGKTWGALTMVAMSVSLWGAMTAYIIIGGKFLHILFSPLFGGPEALYSLLIAGLASILISRGIQFAARIEVPIIISLIFLFAFIFLSTIGKVSFDNLTYINLDNAFLPYGVILFAMAGIGMVPELKAVLGRKNIKHLPQVLVIGMTIITIIYATFSLGVVGVTGLQTSPAAFDGLVPEFGNLFRIVGALLGSITIISIYMILGIQQANLFKFDFNVSHLKASMLSIVVPIALFIFGVKEFIELISFVGGVFVGLLGITIILTYEKMRRSPVCQSHQCINFPRVLSFALILIFIFGIIHQLSSLV